MFSGEYLCLSCSADHEVISTKKSILQNHCKSKKHTRGKETLFTFKMDRDYYYWSLERWRKAIEIKHSVSKRACVPCAGGKEFSKTWFSTARATLITFVIFLKGVNTGWPIVPTYVSCSILSWSKRQRLKGEIPLCSSHGIQTTRDPSVIFHGSTRPGEAIAKWIIVRFVDDNWSTAQGLIVIRTNIF